MKYLIILYATYNDGKQTKKSMYEFDTENEAVAEWHGYMSVYRKDATVSHVTCTVMNTDGMIKRTEVYDRKKEEENEKR